MRRLLFATVLCLLYALPLQSQSPTVFFDVNWDGEVLGCDRARFRNATGGATNSFADLWASWANNTTFCTPMPPWAEIVSDNVWSGTRALKKWWAFGHQVGDGGGPELTLYKAVGGRNEIWIRQHTYFSPTFRVRADLKNIIVGTSDSSQDAYLQFRPSSVTNAAGLLNVHLGSNVQVASANGTLMQNSWNCIEWHVRAGSNALVEARLNSQVVQWNNGATSLTGSTPGSTIAFAKYDTYHNGFGSVDQNTAPYYRIDDSWQYCTGTWCGCAPRGGGAPVDGPRLRMRTRVASVTAPFSGVEAM